MSISNALLGVLAQVVTQLGGLVWALRAAVVKQFYSVAYGNGVFIAVGYVNTPLKSTDDGVTWTVLTTPPPNNPQSIVFGNGVFVAISFSGATAYVTSDGGAWVPATVRLAENGYCLTFDGSYFVNYGDLNGRIQYSADGLTWSSGVNPGAGFTPNRFDGGNGIVLAPVLGGSLFRSSDHGATWSNIGANPFGTYGSVFGYGQGKWVCLSSETSQTTVKQSTDNGSTWANVGTRPGGYVRSLQFANGVWLAASSSGVFRSLDGVTWTLVQGGLETNTPDWYATAASPTTFVIVSTSSLNTIRSSPVTP